MNWETGSDIECDSDTVAAFAAASSDSYTKASGAAVWYLQGKPPSRCLFLAVHIRVG
jgi:hypothetical protein